MNEAGELGKQIFHKRIKIRVSWRKNIRKIFDNIMHEKNYLR